MMLLPACEKEETVFEGPYYVRFTETEASARESFNQPIKISVHLVGPQRSEPVTVRYNVGGRARRGVDYQIEGEVGTVVIPANQSFGYITLRLLNNANNILESQDIFFNIISVTPEDLQIGFSKDGIIGRSSTFTIQDDCILSGTYAGIREGGADVPPLTGIAITSTDCQQYLVANWNISLSTLPSIPFGFTFIDNGDNTLTIPIQGNDLMSFDELLYNGIELANDTLQGNGSVNPLNGRLTFNIEVTAKGSLEQDSAVFFPITYIPER